MSRKTIIYFVGSVFAIVGVASAVLWGLKHADDHLHADEIAKGTKVKLEEGVQVPDFKIQRFSSNSELIPISKVGAKVTLVNFWASWCSACLIEMPSIVRLRDKFNSRGLEVVALNVDTNPASDIPPLLPRLGINFPVYLDPQGKVSDLFDVREIPLTFIIDRTRTILAVALGERDWDSREVNLAMEKWLSQ
jgi:thiol-disulfide isomerase/thioredoxin